MTFKNQRYFIGSQERWHQEKEKKKNAQYEGKYYMALPTYVEFADMIGKE